MFYESILGVRNKYQIDQFRIKEIDPLVESLKASTEYKYEILLGISSNTIPDCSAMFVYRLYYDDTTNIQIEYIKAIATEDEVTVNLIYVPDELEHLDSLLISLYLNHVSTRHMYQRLTICELITLFKARGIFYGARGKHQIIHHLPQAKL